MLFLEGADEFEGEIEEDESHEEDIGADEDISIKRIGEIGAEEEGMCDDSDVDKDIEEVCDAPDSVWNHWFHPAGKDENDEAVECENAEGEGKRVEFIGPERDKNIGKGRLEIGIKQEASAMKKGKKEGLKSEGMMRGEGIGGLQNFVEDREADGDAQENDDPRKRERDETGGARKIPDPRNLPCGCVGGDSGCR